MHACKETGTQHIKTSAKIHLKTLSRALDFHLFHLFRVFFFSFTDISNVNDV